MKHAGRIALDRLAPLLAEIRQRPALKERSTGVFYARSRAFLHFHEDPAGTFADLRGDAGFDRFEIDTPAQRAAFLEALDRALGGR